MYFDQTPKIRIKFFTTRIENRNRTFKNILQYIQRLKHTKSQIKLQAKFFVQKIFDVKKFSAKNEFKKFRKPKKIRRKSISKNFEALSKKKTALRFGIPLKGHMGSLMMTKSK